MASGMLGPKFRSDFPGLAWVLKPWGACTEGVRWDDGTGPTAAAESIE